MNSGASGLSLDPYKKEVVRNCQGNSYDNDSYGRIYTSLLWPDGVFTCAACRSSSSAELSAWPLAEFVCFATDRFGVYEPWSLLAFSPSGLDSILGLRKVYQTMIISSHISKGMSLGKPYLLGPQLCVLASG